MILTKMSTLLQTQLVRSRSCKMQREDERSEAFRTKCLKGRVFLCPVHTSTNFE